MRRGWLGLAIVLAACGGTHSGGPSDRPGPMTGDFALRVERPQGTPFEGQLVLTPDTAVVIAKATSCRPGTIQPSPNVVLIRCDDVLITVDRFGAYPKVTATVDVLRSITRRQCVAYAEGGTRCIRFETIVSGHRLETVSARAVVTRAVKEG